MRAVPLVPATLAVLALAGLPGASSAATFPIEPGEVVVTSSPYGLVPTGPGSRFVVTIVDVRDPLCNAALNTAWDAPRYVNRMPNPTLSPADEWTDANLGQVFGITLDDATPPSIYVAASASYNVVSGSGRVSRIDGATGAISTFADLPNSGPGLGNIAFDRARGQFFVSDLEDGRIYRLDRAGTVLDAFDPLAPDDGRPGFVSLGERPWAVGVSGARLYFSIWEEDMGRPSPLKVNTVWSAALDPATGAVDPADVTLEVTLPPFDATFPPYSNPVASLDFNPAGEMLLAERSMEDDETPEAHHARVLKYAGGHLAWQPVPASFVIGEINSGTNAAGGVGEDCDPAAACSAGARLWATGDALHLRVASADFIYGIQGLPASGGDATTSYMVDLDGVSNPGAKTALGDLDVYRTCPPVVPCTPPVARTSGAPRLCRGDALVLDGTASTGCAPSALEFRWLEGASVVCDWSPSPSCAVSPGGATTYALEVRCAADAACSASVAVAVVVDPPPVPALAVPPLVCAGDAVTLDASGSGGGGCAGPVELQFSDGAGVLCPWSAFATCGPLVPAASAGYTVEARCGACTRSASAALEVVARPIAVAAAGASPCPGEAVTLDASASGGCGGGALEHRWLEGATVVCGWSPSATCAAVPAGATVYTLETRCQALASCTSATTVPVSPAPAPVATLAAPALVCAGGTVDLDASGSAGNGCAVPLEYQFRDGVTVLRAWSPVAVFGPVSPAATTTYAVDVRCGSCPSTASTTVAVVELPRAAAGPDTAACVGSPVLLDASASDVSACPTGALYEWWEGTVLVRAADTDPTWAPPTTGPGVKVYTVRVRCAGIAACEAADDATVTLSSCSMAVRFDSYQAERTADGVVVRFRTLEEDGTSYFAIERAPDAGGSPGAFAPALGLLDARGSGSAYAIDDRSPGAVATAWYRVVEYTSAGRGDSTAAFRALDRAGAGAATRTGAARGRVLSRDRTRASGR